MRVNAKAKDYRVDMKARTAGGFGPFAAAQNPEALLRRSVMANLLWEKTFYEDGLSVAENIKSLIPQVDPGVCGQIAIEARFDQKLRHVPLLILREMARHESHRHMLGDLLPKVIRRPDEITEFVAMYWMEGKCPLSGQIKKGLAKCFEKFDQYQLAKYDRATEVKLRDVLFLVHGKPKTKEGDVDIAPAIDRESYKRGPTDRHDYAETGFLVDGTLPTPDTWEVEISASKDKKGSWTRLIKENKLGALAYVRNLRNMEEAGVDRALIIEGLQKVDPTWLLPINFVSAQQAAPTFIRPLENLMFRCFEDMPKLPGHTVFVVDVSGSMSVSISKKSEMTRMDLAATMAMFASEICEDVTIYATAGSDYHRKHITKRVEASRGFGLARQIVDMMHQLGGGGIFTRQCVDFIRGDLLGQKVDRIMIFSDSQDCDVPGSGLPQPFGTTNYIIDVSAHKRGIGYDGVWTAEISGWSEKFLEYIYQMEFQGIQQ